MAAMMEDSRVNRSQWANPFVWEQRKITLNSKMKNVSNVILSSSDV